MEISVVAFAPVKHGGCQRLSATSGDGGGSDVGRGRRGPDVAVRDRHPTVALLSGPWLPASLITSPFLTLFRFKSSTDLPSAM